MCKPRVCWSSGVVFTSPSLWSSASLDSSWCISSNPCEKNSKHRFSHLFSVGRINSDKQIGSLLHIILEQKFIWHVQKVYNVVCLLINSIGSKRFNLKAQSRHQTKWDCPEKQQQQSVFFYPTKLSRKISKKFMHTEDEKFQLQFKYELIRSYRIRTKNHTVHWLVHE